MNHFEEFKQVLSEYLSAGESSFVATLQETSKNAEGGEGVNYLSSAGLAVISMDEVAKGGYRRIKDPGQNGNPVNTADAFLIDQKNEWYLIEFKDCTISAKKQGIKDNIIKKAYANWYMILDIFYTMQETGRKSHIFDTGNPVRFAKEHVSYIVVCSRDKNVSIYDQVKNRQLIHEKYTPSFMQRLKDYLFKDAYVYTEDFFQWEFVRNFTYE